MSPHPLPASTPPAPPRTLREVNAVLTALNLPTLTPAHRQALLAIEPPGRVLRALRLAQQGDAGSRVYLDRVLTAVTAAPSAGMPPTGGPTNVVPWPATAATTPPAASSPAPAPAAAPPPAASTRPRSKTAGVSPADPAAARADSRRNVHVYGGKAALTFEPDITRHGAPTLVLDAALATGVRQYDWEHKIRIQWSLDELPVVLAVLLGWLPRCEFTGHGERHDKGFSLENQPEKGTVFVRVFAKDQGVRAVPMPAGAAWQVAGLALAQCQANSPGLTATEVMTLVKHTVVRLTPPVKDS